MLLIWLIKFASGPVSPSCVFRYAYSRGAEKKCQIQLSLDVYRHTLLLFEGSWFFRSQKEGLSEGRECRFVQDGAPKPLYIGTH
jgi:hypothetical protein